MHNPRLNFMLTLFLLCLCIPIVGWVIAFVAILSRLLKIKTKERSHFLPLEQERNDIVQIQKPNIHKETNTVSLVEVLDFLDFPSRRALMLDILKKDIHPFTSFLLKAVNNEDTETSHYAASALTAVRQKMLHHLQQLSNQYESNLISYDFLHTYSNELSHYLELGILDHDLETRFRQKNVQVCIDLIMLGRPKKEYFIKVVQESIKLKDYELASQYCDEMKQFFQEDEDTYTWTAKCCYAQKRGKELQNAIHSLLNLKNRSLRVTKQMEYWLKGV